MLSIEGKNLRFMQDYKSNSPQVLPVGSETPSSFEESTEQNSKNDVWKRISRLPFDMCSVSSSQESMAVKKPRLEDLQADSESLGQGECGSICLLRQEIDFVTNLVSLAEKDHNELESFIRCFEPAESGGSI